MKFPVGCVTRRHQHSRMFARVIDRNVNQRGNINARQALENELFDGEPIHRNLAGDFSVQVRLHGGQAANHLEKFLPQLFL